MSNTVFVGNLSYAVRAAELQSAFDTFGEITEAKVITDHMTGRSKGYGFVTYSSASDAQKAVETMNEKEISGRNIRVNIARNKTNNGYGGYSQGQNRRPHGEYRRYDDQNGQ